MSPSKKFKSIFLDTARDYLHFYHGKCRLLQERRRRKSIFNLAISRFISDPIGTINGQDGVISDLIFGWGNEQWSALDQYLRECLKLAATANCPILECGSGLSTILLGIVAQNAGNTVWTLEHNPEWAAKAIGILQKLQITSVHMMVSPLKSFGDVAWYDPPLNAMPDKFSIVVCDGPPACTPGGRYGLLPIMKEKLTPGCLILLDDADRKEERSIGMRWAEELNGSYELRGTVNPYMIISLPRQQI